MADESTTPDPGESRIEESTDEAVIRPLSGVKVLEFTHSASGPYAGQLLADWGAEVIKIEPPQGAFERDAGRHHHYMGNRGKRSVCLDLKTERGKAIVFDLVDEYDVVIENYRPGALSDLGLGYEELRARNEEVIHCSISGFGLSGPKRDWPAFDPIAQAVSGIMHMTGERDRKPARVGASLLDYGSATVACFGIVMAILHRMRTGTGIQVESSMLDTAFAWSGTWAVYHSLHGKIPERMGDRIATYAPVGAYETIDSLVYISAFGDTSWQKLCDALDLEALVEDDRFATPAARCENRDALDKRIESRTTEFRSDELIETLLAKSVPCAPIQSPVDAMEDQHLLERGMVQSITSEFGEPVTHAGNPVRLGDSVAVRHDHVPALGADTTDVLSDNLGYSAAKIETLRSDGVVGPVQ